MFKKLILYHIIYIAFTSILFCQNFSLEIKGKDTISQHKIDSIFIPAKFKDYKSIESRVNELSKQLNQLGYFDKSISPIKRISDSIFEVELQVNTRYKKITLNHKALDFPLDLIKKHSLNFNLNTFDVEISKLEFLLSEISSHYINKGYTFSYVQIVEIFKNQKGALEGTLIVDKKQKRTIDNIIVKGYEKFPKSYLKYFFGIKKKQDLNIESIKRKTNRFNNLPFVTQARDPEILFNKDSTTLYFYLKKQNNNNFDGYLGFTNNEESSKIEFNGYIDLRLSNNLNFGEQINLNYRSNENKQRTFDLKTDIPFLFNSPIGINFGLNIFKQDSTFLTTHQKIQVSYQVNRNLRLLSGLSSITSEKLVDSINISNVVDFKTRYLNTQVQFNSGNYTFLNRSKSQASLAIKFGNRETDSTSTRQLSSFLRASHLFNLNSKNHILLKSETFYINSDQVLNNELYRFGGITSIRGFQEQSLSASFATVLNTEYIYNLNQSLYINSIIDIGFFEDNTINVKENLIGLGFGFGLQTNSNLFRLIFANGKTGSQNFDLGNSKIHISLTTSF